MDNPIAERLVLPERAPADSRDHNHPENLKIPTLGHNHKIPLVTEKSKCLFEGKYLLNRGSFLGRSRPGALAHIDIQALDLLVERRERNAQRLGGRGLAPIGRLQLFDNLTALVIRHDLKQ